MTKILLPMDETNLTWDELIPGTVVLDGDGDEWTRREDGWYLAGYTFKAWRHGIPSVYEPFTVVLEVPLKPQDLVDGLRWDPKQGTDLAGLVKTEWGVRDKLGVRAAESDSAARTIVGNMRKEFDPEASVVWRGVTEWQEADKW